MSIHFYTTNNIFIGKYLKKILYLTKKKSIANES